MRCSPSLSTRAELVSTADFQPGNGYEPCGYSLAALRTRDSCIRLDASELCRFCRNSLKTPKFLWPRKNEMTAWAKKSETAP